MSTPWAAQLPSAIPVRDLLAVAQESGDDAVVCVFAPSDAIDQADRRGYAALVVAYTRFEEPVAVLDDGCCALLIREGGPSAATAAARRILSQAGRLGLSAQLRVGVALVRGSAQSALESARLQAAGGQPGEVAGAA